MPAPSDLSIDRCVRFAEQCQERADELKAEAYIARGPEALPAAELVAAAVGGRVYCDVVALPPLPRPAVEPEPPQPESALLEHAFESYLRNVAGLMTTGWALKDRLRRFGPPVTVLPDYHDAAAVGAAGSHRLRTEHGLRADHRLLLAAGRTIGGFRPIVGAMPMLPGEVHLAVLSGIAEPAELQSCVADQGITGRVHFLPAGCDADVVGIAREAELGVIAVDPSLPKEAVSLPARLFDFIAAGLPIVAPDVPDIARIVEERELGLTVRGDDADAWSDAITKGLARGAALRANVVAAAPDLAWELLDDAVHAACGNAGRVSFLSCGDLIGDRRTSRMAKSLAGRGVAVTLCCPGSGPLPAETNPHLRYLTLAAVDGSGAAVAGDSRCGA